LPTSVGFASTLVPNPQPREHALPTISTVHQNDILLQMDSHLRKLGVLMLTGITAAALALASCSPGSDAPQDGSLGRVVATLSPVEALIRPLLPGEISCEAIIGPGEGVHGHRVSPAELAQTRSADVVFAVGLGLDSSILTDLQQRPGDGQTVVVFADIVNIQSPPDQACGEHDHSDDHGHEHDGHEHGRVDPHLWLDPVLAASFVEGATGVLITRANSTGNTTLGDQIRSRSQAWLEKIHAIDQKYREQLSPFAGSVVLTPHPAFGRMLERYGLEEVSFSPASPHSLPTPAQVASAVRYARDKHASAIFTEPLAPVGLAEKISGQTGIPIGTLDPLGQGDWEAMMNANLDSLVRTLSAGANTAGDSP